MAYEINKSEHDALGYDLRKKVAEHRAALEAFARTENVPAPVAHDPIVETILREHGGELLVIDDTPPPRTFEQEKKRLFDNVDRDAEGKRGQYITQYGVGQTLVYSAKQREVARWSDADRPASVVAEDYPWANDRAARAGMPITDVLAEWETKTLEWFDAAIAIEAVREDAKEQIRAATSIEQAQAIYDSIVWPEAST